MTAQTATAPNVSAHRPVEAVVIRFAGDSGDGVQLTGSQFTQATALMGNDLATLPNFPAEIRAPAGTTYGVSSFQIQFAAHAVHTPGDAPDVLVALNPAALKVHLADLPRGGVVVADAGAFTARNLAKADYAANPLDDGTLDAYQTLLIDISQQTLKAVEGSGLSHKDALRCKNFWALGLMLWMYGRDPQPVAAWIGRRFAAQPALAAANRAALDAGHAYGETHELEAHRVPRAPTAPGLYRTVTGSQALAWGLLAGVHKTGLSKLFFGSYPITPASALLHTLSGLRQYGVTTFQAEDEIAAVCAAIGASYAGAVGVTATSGPGMALKTEALGLAVSTELPLVVVNCQRAGPSTGMPTKTEQADLHQAVFGRNGDTPLPVLAAATPGDCFYTALEAVRIATRYMTPVILLADGYLVNAAEPWAIPDLDAIAGFPVAFHTDAEGFHPFLRDAQTLARVWAVPGTPGLEHRIGGIEKDHDSGHISYDPANHQRMTRVRAAKIAGIADAIPEQAVALGEDRGRLAVVGWGSTYGALHQAVSRARARGLAASHIHLRHIHPLPRNLGRLLRGFDKVLVAELNNGQLLTLLRSEYLIAAEGLNQVNGLPFKVADLEQAIGARLETA
ncbi:MAG: 2-oxoacid:acceptor oxidoreductase subunit alpha [Pseudomonadota bacterium]|nr:2-oxoacid:acceptor oxidoreductase subunit alpha [Pseudomonadota bacterium]